MTPKGDGQEIVREHTFPARLRKLSYLIGRAGRVKFAALFVLMIANAILEMAGIGAIPLFILILSSPETVLKNPWAGPMLTWLHIVSPKSLMIWGSFFLVGLFAFKNIFFSLLIYIKTKMIYNEQIQFGDRLFKAYMTAEYTFFLNRNSAELLRNVHNETRLIISGVLMPLMQIILDGLVLLMIVCLLLSVEPLVSLVTFVLLTAISILYAKITGGKTKAYGKEEQQHRKKMREYILEGVSGIKDIKVLGREKHFLDRYHFSSVRTVRALRYKQMISQLPRPVMETITLIGMLFMVLALLLLERQIASLIPLLALFGAATVRLLPVLRTILSSFIDVRYNIYAVDPVYRDLMLLENRAPSPSDSEDLISSHVHQAVLKIELKDVGFRYPQGRTQAVGHISMEIPGGSVIGLVGPSGAGKTTIVDILLGLLKPQEGEVLADGWNIFEDVRRWRANVGYIPQFIYLSDDTIRRNIALGLPDDEIDERKILKTIKASQLKDLIANLPEGLDTMVGERGIRLSGGQRQRIGIARSLYNNPRILIMDEATSSLDNVAEKHVIESIERLRGDRTIIMIAHRLTTVQNCDVIYLMKDGRIVEQGSYEYLLKNSNEFRKMSLLD